jgi:hypothetical protein
VIVEMTAPTIKAEWKPPFLYSLEFQPD